MDFQVNGQYRFDGLPLFGAITHVYTGAYDGKHTFFMVTDGGEKAGSATLTDDQLAGYTITELQPGDDGYVDGVDISGFSQFQNSLERLRKAGEEGEELSQEEFFGELFGGMMPGF